MNPENPFSDEHRGVAHGKVLALFATLGIMKITLNSQDVELPDGDPIRPLLWVLRDELGLSGTKFGCGIGICGACSVQVNGVTMRTCSTPVVSVEGADVRTVEGLATQTSAGEQLHPIQQAFIDEQVPQCSWCMSGQMMTAVSLLEQNPAPTDEEIVNAMGNNYCRCGCYVRIKAAVKRAATMMQETRA